MAMQRLWRSIHPRTLKASLWIAVAVAFLAWAARPAAALTVEELAQLKSPDRQKILEDGARKEGKVIWYSSLTIDTVLRPLAQAFEKKYPFIKVELWRAESAKIVQKITAEVRAKNVEGDIIEGSGIAEAIIKSGVTLPFYSPELDAYPPAYRDANGLWAATRFAYYGVGYNTKLVKKEDVPKTYEDLLDPKWKGKMAWRVGSDTGVELFITALRTTWGDEKTENYLKRLAGQKIVGYTGSARALVNQVMAGEYPLAINIFLHHPIDSASHGASVASQPMEPVPSTIGTIMLPKGIKRPHAAMLSIDFLLSKEGQTVLREENYLPAHPQVDPLPALHPIVPRLAGLKETVLSPEVMFKYGKSSTAMYQKYFRQ
jgi:iron(III) transport system substrate-binding protein